MTSKSLTILLVEDNEINTMVAQHMLEQNGYRVISVTNGQDAVAAVQAHQFDLVLMDIHMPIMDGEEATKQIRALSETRQANRAKQYDQHHSKSDVCFH